MKKNIKISYFLVVALLIQSVIFAQSIPTLELPRSSSGVSGNGVTLGPLTALFTNDALNNNSFTVNSPAVTVTASFRNQAFTGLNYGTGSSAQTTGLVFGLVPTTGSSSVLGGEPFARWQSLGAFTGSFGPTNNMFTSNPTASGPQLGTGIEGTTFSATSGNAGFQIFTTAYELYKQNIPITQRTLFGQLVITFSRPVKNPVIHIAGLGGSVRYSTTTQTDPNPANWRSTFFSTELELQNAGVTSTLMSGNQFFQVSGNNILNSNNVNPNGASVNDPSVLTPPAFNEFGAATGSVRINGSVQELVYNVYLEGGTGSQFAWSVDKSNVSGAVTDPFSGDIWFLSASLDKPIQQISGNVFNDRDGLIDNNINQSVGVANPKTNAGGLFANLLNAAGTTVVASVAVGSDGVYLFDNVAFGNYSVQLSTNQGVPGQPRPVTALPTNWVNTGENGSNTPGNGTGSDGTINGISDLVTPITVAANDIKTEVNFGIERLPESVSFTRVIPSPSIGTVMTLSPLSNLPVLTGSDPEDQPVSGTLSGKTVVLTNLPNNATMKYNNVNVVSGTPIPNYNPNLLTITFNGPAQASSQFNYAYVDASGRPDPSPALYRLVWSGGPLAITLTDFTAIKNNCIAGLTWKTASEINASRFEIEVSNTSNAVYNKVGSLNATATNGKTYQFTYPMQAGTQYYFRLKMIDKDGSFKYSDVRTLNCDGKGTKITIAPNPVVDQFVISGMENGRNTISIFTSNGQLIKTQTIAQPQGYVKISNLAAGMYSVKIISEKGNVTVGKLIKN